MFPGFDLQGTITLIAGLLLDLITLIAGATMSTSFGVQPPPPVCARLLLGSAWRVPLLRAFGDSIGSGCRINPALRVM